MVLVGAAPHFREDFEKNIHTAGAILCIGFSQLWVTLVCPWCLTVWAAYLVYTIVGMRVWRGRSVKESFMRTNSMFWVEIAALAAVYASLVVNV